MKRKLYDINKGFKKMEKWDSKKHIFKRMSITLSPYLLYFIFLYIEYNTGEEFSTIFFVGFATIVFLLSTIIILVLSNMDKDLILDSTLKVMRFDKYISDNIDAFSRIDTKKIKEVFKSTIKVS
jgi:hypothetical protein